MATQRTTQTAAHDLVIRDGLVVDDTGAPARRADATCGSSTEEWRHTPKAQETLQAGLIGSPETIRRKLAQFEASNVDQVILLNQTGRTSHEDICSSLELFARDVMPEFHAREPEHPRWKEDVLAGRITLEDLAKEAGNPS